jgi:hypothetical protein
VRRRHQWRVYEAVLISHEDIEETLAVLSDADLIQQIRQSEAAAAERDVASLDGLRKGLGHNPKCDR